MSYCKNCGEKLPEGANYCPKCGKKMIPTTWEEIQINTDQLISRVKELIEEGNINRIVVKNVEGKNLLEIPVTITVIGTLLAPYLAALGAIAAIATRCTIAIEKPIKQSSPKVDNN